MTQVLEGQERPKLRALLTTLRLIDGMTIHKIVGLAFAMIAVGGDAIANLG